MQRDVFVRNPYNYDVDQASDDAGLKCEDESLTQQDQREDADINVIMKRFGVTGVAPQVAMPPTYGDFDQVSDYRTALDLIREADRSFMSLPADVRKRFDGDPAAFVDFASDPANLEEMRKMGLAPQVEVSNVSSEVKGAAGSSSETSSGTDSGSGSGKVSQ